MFREHEFNRFNPYVLHHLMNKSGLHAHVGYELGEESIILVLAQNGHIKFYR
jgi:hypothetical protein